MDSVGGDKPTEGQSSRFATQFLALPRMTQLQEILFSLCDVGGETLAIVKNSNRTDGLEARRSLTVRFDEENSQANRQLRRILCPTS